MKPFARRIKLVSPSPQVLICSSPCPPRNEKNTLHIPRDGLSIVNFSGNLAYAKPMPIRVSTNLTLNFLGFCRLSGFRKQNQKPVDDQQ